MIVAKIRLAIAAINLSMATWFSRKNGPADFLSVWHDDQLAVGRSQKGMQRRHDLCALADRRRDPLNRTRPYIADGEDALAAGFQRSVTDSSICAGQHETLGVQRYAGPG